MKIIFLFLSLMVSKILEISMWKHSDIDVEAFKKGRNEPLDA
jgi:hypothetical protein